ncbi:RibD family protein [Heyndrickxia oleronia]|uniref:RibD family protein n=1 Tax=Heyndrickxia oleronia TaxID=38875 RepID=UPI00203B13BF|nr:RibD family protein [Heyndrickxia oleronia]MCM3236131.1 RibD family protein [Heyndrickxia oleronia]
MKKPEIILNVFSSLDGRITTAPDRNVTEWTAAGIDGDAHEVTNQLYDELECDGLISGSETLMVYGKHWIELTQPLYEPKNSKAYIVFDGQGRINWYQTEGLVVVTKENVADKYIQQLENKGITYIKAGNGQHVDIKLALQILYNMGFRKLGLSGGGTFNGAFLRQGLIDEISLVIAPLAIGGKHTPTLFDCDDLQRLDDITKLELQNIKPIGKGSVWLHYKVR